MNSSTIRTKYCCLIILLSCIIYIGLPLQSSAATFSSPINIDVVNAKVDLLIKIIDKILNSVYWTLGILSAIFLGLISVNLYFNISANKREFEKHKTEIENLVSSLIKTAEQDIREKNNEVTQKEIGRIKEEISNITISAIKTSESALTEKINELTQREIEKASNNILNTAKNEMLINRAEIIKLCDDSGKRIDTLASSFKQNENDLRQLDINVKQLEAYRFANENKYGAIMRLLEILEYDLKYRPWNIKYTLPEILKITSSSTLAVDDANKLRTLLEKIEDEEFKELVNKISDSISIIEPK